MSAPNSAWSGGSGSVSGVNAPLTASPDSSRSLVFDERFFEEQFLKCQVCHERFDQIHRSPKSLPCNHTFCLPCLSQIFDHAQPPVRRTVTWADETNDGTLKCPTCRVEIFLSRNQIKELPNDHHVVQMMDFVSQALAKSQNSCPKHDRQPLSFFCKKCLTPVCRDCTVLDHKDSEGHKIIDVSEALNEYTEDFDETENRSRNALEKMKSMSDSLTNASKRLDILERRLTNEIKDAFIEYRLLLEKRQEALTSMVRQIVKDQKTKINSQSVSVCEQGTQLQKLYDEFKASRNNNDIWKLFTVNQQIQGHENHFMLTVSQDDSDLFQSCDFEPQNEDSFLSDLSSLGEIKMKLDLELKEPVTKQELEYLKSEEQREREGFINSETINALLNEDFPLRTDKPELPSHLYLHHNNLTGRTAILGIIQPETLPNLQPETLPNLQPITLPNLQPITLPIFTQIPDQGSRRQSTPESRRRSRDTNNHQVQSSLGPGTPENLDYLNPIPVPGGFHYAALHFDRSRSQLRYPPPPGPETGVLHFSQRRH